MVPRIEAHWNEAQTMEQTTVGQTTEDWMIAAH
jgi:hypothetical protein